MPSEKRTLERHMHICEKCGHRWLSRLERPKKCPRCTSPNWSAEEAQEEETA